MLSKKICIFYYLIVKFDIEHGKAIFSGSGKYETILYRAERDKKKL